jgi:ornithine carbamoyltransferase
MTRHIISLDDLSDEELLEIVHRGAEIAAGGATGEPLLGAVVGIYFRKTSTRTRTAFSAGALRLGARIVSYGPNDLQTNTGETLEDTGRVLSGMLDMLVARTAESPAELWSYAGHQRMSVINAMTADEHPTQAIADLTTMLRHFGRLDGLRVLYVGEGSNNTATALVRGLTRLPGLRLELRTPPGYGLPEDTVRTGHRQAERSGGSLVERHDMADVPNGLDVIYTARWQTTGTTKPDPDWRAAFAPFQVGAWLLDRNPGAVFMHDLPAHRGEEVTAEVLDGPHSIAFEQAVTKMHSAMAVLEWCHGVRTPSPGRYAHVEPAGR